GQTHEYSIRLKAAQFINVIVQQGIDVSVWLTAPDGKPVAGIDWEGKDGIESLWALAESEGLYKLEIVLADKLSKAGTYSVKINRIGEWQTATSREQSLINANRLSWDAGELTEEGKVESLKKSIDKYSESLPLWRAGNDITGEAHALNEIGF